jgi:hypothetical protein
MLALPSHWSLERAAPKCRGGAAGAAQLAAVRFNNRSSLPFTKAEKQAISVKQYLRQK